MNPISKYSPRLQRHLLGGVLVALAAMLLANGSLTAAVFYWDSDGNGANGVVGGGPGNWNTAAPNNWDPDANNTNNNNTIWSNAGNDTAIFAGLAGAVTLTAPITVGGLQFNTTGYSITTGANTLTFGATNNVITLNNVAGATITGAVAGTGNVTLSGGVFGGNTAGTLNLNGTSATGWSGSTTINNGMTLTLSGLNQGLVSTSGITLNGGKLTLINALAESGLNRVNNAAGITSNGGTITWTNTAGATNYAETLGILTLVSGQTNIITTNANGPGQTEILTLSGLTRSGGTNTSTVAFGGTSLGAPLSINQINITGQAATAVDQIIGPWATYGASAASQTDYATYNITGGAGNAQGIQGANIAASLESAWTNPANTYTQGASQTLTATRTITALRNTGATAITDLGANNLQTFGLLNGASTLWTIDGTGILRQQGTAAANLYVTTGAGAITINTRINNNTGALTLVKSGEGGVLTLTSTTGTYTGGTVINAGTISIGNNLNLGFSTGSLTFNNSGGLTLTAGITLGTSNVANSREIILNNGALATITTGAFNHSFIGNIRGSGGFIINGNAGNTLTFGQTRSTSTYTGPTIINQGTLKAGVINAFGNNSAVSLANIAGATLDITGFNTTIGSLSGGGALGGNVTLGAATLTIGGNNENTSYDGIISGTGSLAKTGTGILTLTRASTYTGSTIINQGTLKAGVINAFGNNSAVTFANTAGATLDITGFNTAIGSLAGGGVTGGNVTLGAATLTVGGNNLSTSYGGVISGTGAMTKTGTGTLTLTGANAYTGITTISAGALQLGNGILDGSISNSSNITNNAALIYNIAGSQSYSGIISGTGTVTKNGAGTQTLTGNNNYTGATTINGGTLELSGATGTLASTSGIILNGGNLTLTNQVAESGVNRVNNAATITSNGGTITWTNTPGAVNYAETLGPLSLISGNTNVITPNPNGAGQATLTFSNFTRAAGATSTIAFGGPVLGVGASNQIKFSAGVAFTPANQIIGPWATYGALAALQTDYAINNNANGIQGANIAGTGQASWTVGTNAYTQNTALETLGGTRTITALRNTGTNAVTALNGNSLETFGLLNGASTTWTISGTGSIRQQGTAAANLFVNAGAGAITISAPITNNTGALTLVKSGEGLLTLSGTNTYTGNTIVNAGTLSIGSGGSIASASTFNLTNSTLQLNPIGTSASGLSRRVFAAASSGANTSTFNFTQAATTISTDLNLNYTSLSTQPPNPILPSVDNVTIQWVGQIKINTAGTYTFGTSSDDGSRLWIDGVLVVNNDGGKGTTNSTNTVTLTAGRHDIRVDYTNGTGGAAEILTYNGADTANATVPVPNAVLFQAQSNTLASATTAVNYGNNVTVTGNSTINLAGTDFTQVQLGTLSVGTGSTLNVTGDVGKTMRVGNTTFGGAVGTVTLNATPNIAFDGIVSEGAAGMNIIKQGVGRLIFSQTDVNNPLTATTTLDIQGGSLVLLGSKPTVGLPFNPIGAAKIKLSGNGVSLVLDAKINNASTPLIYDNAIEVSANATIQSINNANTITLGGVTNGISITNASTLTLDAIAGGNPVASLGATINIDGPVSGVAGSVISFKSTQLGSFAGAVGGVINLRGDFSAGYDGDFSFTGTKEVTVRGNGINQLDLKGGKNYSIDVGTGSLGNITAKIGEVSGVVGLIKNGDGILTLSSLSSDYSGPTIINGGILKITRMNNSGVSSSIGLGGGSNNALAAAKLVLNGGTLSFIGNPSLDPAQIAIGSRPFTLGLGATAGTISADGLGVNSEFKWGSFGGTETVEFLGSGTRTLTLGGVNKGNNIFGVALGELGGATSVRKTGAGTWIMAETNSYTGGTTIDAGILSAAVDGAVGTGNVTVNTGGIFELRGVTYTSTTPTIILQNGSTLTAVRNTDAGFGTGVGGTPIANNSSWAGGLTVNGIAANSGTISVNSGADLAIKGTIGGTGGIVQLGSGSVTFSGVASGARNTSSTATYTTQSGTLILDYAAPGGNGSKLSDSAELFLGGSRLGGTVNLVGGSHVEIVSKVTLNSGDNVITRTGGTSVLRMNLIDRKIGATLRLSAANIASTDSPNDATGILGAWATVGLNDWATKTGTNDLNAPISGADNGLIGVYTGYLPSSVPANWVLGNNLTVDATSNPTAGTAANSLRFFAPDGDLEQTVTLAGANRILSGGILIAANMGTTAAVINGPGSLAGPAASFGDLLIIQNNVQAAFEISADIVNNPGFVNGVDKSGLGNLILSGDANTYTGITTLSNGVTTVHTLGALGAATGIDRLVFNGGTLQLNAVGGLTTSARGFTVNETAVWDIGNENTTLSFSGANFLYATPVAAGNYVGNKIGSGTLEFVKTTAALSSGYGLTGWEVSDGTLRLSAGVTNQYARSDAALTMSGGTLEFIGTGAPSTTVEQVMSGAFTVGEGSSVIRVKSASGMTSILTLQNTTNPTFITNQRGGTLLISEDVSGGGTSIIRIAGELGVDLMEILPRMLYQTTADDKNPGVNYFAVITTPSYNVVASDNVAIGGIPSHQTISNVATWQATNDVTDGALAGEAYSGTIVSDTSVNTIRFFNNAGSPSVVNIASGKFLTIESGAILQTTHSGTTSKSITGAGWLTSNLFNYDANGFATSADLIVHNWNPIRPLLISAIITDSFDFSDVSLNLIQSGNGTTIISGANDYTGMTFVQGGVLRLDSATALPGGSHLRLDGGVLGLNSGNFTRGLGTGATQVDWTSSGGFAAYGSDRTVNLGGLAATVEWGAGSFVPDNDSFILGAYDATNTILFQNGINLGRKDRMIRAVDGTALVDGRLNGVISGITGALVKSGQGGLELAAVNTYAAGTSLAQGLLIGSNNASFGTGAVTVGATGDSRAVDAVELRFMGTTLANAITVGNASLGNTESISTIRTTNAAVAVTGPVNLQKQTFLAPVTGSTAAYTNITGTKGFTLIDGGTLSLANANTYGTAAGSPGAAVNGGTIIRNGTILVGNNSSLGSTVVELGDAAFTKTSVVAATNGRSVLTVENSYASNSSGVQALGGVFLADGAGTRTGPGSAIVGGPGAFLNINATINGHLFTTVGERLLVKDETEHPERNGIYEVSAVNAINENGVVTNTINLVRVGDFDEASEMRYGTQVTVTSGGNAGTYFMASPDIVTVNGENDPSQWIQDTLNPGVSLYANAGGLTIANALDVNPNGAGATTIGTTSDLAGVVFSGNVVLQDFQIGVPQPKTLTLNSASMTNPGVLFSGIFSEAVGTGVNADLLSIIKSGAGMATLSGNNTFHGTTSVQTGTLRITHSNALGDTAGGTTVTSGATLEIDGATINGNLAIGNEALTIGGTGVSAGAVNVSGGNNSWAGVVTLAADATVNTAPAAKLTFSNVVQGAFALSKTGTGTLALSGINTYSGVTNVTAGTLIIANNNALGAADGTAGTSTIVTSGATLEIDGAGVNGNLAIGNEALTIGGAGVSSAGAVNVSGGTNTWGGGVTLTSDATVNTAPTAKLTFSNVVQGGFALNKTGAGTLALSGVNTYSGNTNVTAGTLLINNTSGSGTGSGAVAVTGVGTTLGGSGSIVAGANNVNLGAGTILSIGNPGSLVAEDMNITSTGVITLSGQLSFDLYTTNQTSGLNPTATANDRLLLSGSNAVVLNNGSSILAVNSTFAINATNYAVGSIWDLIDWTSLLPTTTFSNITGPTGNYANLPDLSSFGREWNFANLYTTGQISVVAIVPEPGRFGLLAVALAFAILRRRRKH